MSYSPDGKGIFVFTDAAGANSLLAIIDEMMRVGLRPEKDFLVFTNDQGKFDKSEYPFVVNKEFETNWVRNCIQEFQPDYIFTATSIHSYEHEWRKLGAEFGIETLGYVDHWVLYKERFLKNGELLYPDKVLVVNEIAETEAIEEGVPENNIEVFGNPYYNKVATFQPDVSKEQFFKDHKLDLNKKIILFVSESIRYCDDFPKGEDGLSYLGFDEYTVLENVLDSFKEMHDSGFNFSNFTFVIKIHPISEFDKFDSITNSGKYDFLNIEVIKKTNSLNMTYFSDYVTGMFSNMVIEALLMSKKVLRVQCGQRDVELFKFDEIPSMVVRDKSFLTDEIKKWLN